MARPKKDTVKTSNGVEKSMLMSLKEITKSDVEAYFILWKYAPELLPEGETLKTFDDLKNKYAQFENRTEQSMEKAMYKEDVQAATRYLHKRLDGKRQLALLNKYYDLSMSGDVQALKAYMEFRKAYFADQEDDELKSILAGTTIKTDSVDDDDFKMDF